MTTEAPIVEIDNLSKRFDSVEALWKISLNIARGKIVGLVGPNGAGKSTLLRTIVGLYLPDHGTCKTLGQDIKSLEPDQLSRIGYVHQEGNLIDWMSAEELIHYVKAYYNTWNEDLEKQLIRDFSIVLNKRIATLSPGDRQKLAILIAVCFEPELLILDEPAAALDPISRSRFLDLLMKLIQSTNRTIVISSHILSDLEKVIDHTVVMKAGTILRNCSFDELREEFCSVRLLSLERSLPTEIDVRNAINIRREERQAILTVKSSSVENLKQIAAKYQCQIEIKPLTLDEIYEIILEGKAS